jgi:hypothetical protein
MERDRIARLGELRQQQEVKVAELHKIEGEMLSIVIGIVGQPLTPHALSTGTPVQARPILDGLKIAAAAHEYLKWAGNRQVTMRELHDELVSQRVLDAHGKEIRALVARTGTTPKISPAWKAISSALASPKNVKRFRITLPDETPWAVGVRFQPNFVIQLR